MDHHHHHHHHHHHMIPGQEPSAGDGAPQDNFFLGPAGVGIFGSEGFFGRFFLLFF
uniref:Uncharacterized protein n=1 Tax=Aegilops tauschii TaxID=37682 RepID=M8BMN8_AEGTA